MVARFGARASALRPAVALAALMPLLALAPSAVWFALVLATLAVVDSIADVGMNALAVRIEEARGRSIFSRLHGIWSLGSLTGAGVSTLAVAAGAGLVPQLGVTSLVGVVGVAWARRFVTDTGARPRPQPSKGRGGIAMWLALAGAGAAFIEATASDWSAIYLTDALGAGPGIAGAGFVCLSAGMLAGRFGGDHVVDRLGPGRTLLVALAVVAAGVGFTVAASSVATTLAAFGLWGVGVSVVFPLMYSVAGSHPAFSEGAALAALTTGSRFGFLAGPFAVGWLAEASDLPTAFLVVMSGALLACLGSLLTTRR